MTAARLIPFPVHTALRTGTGLLTLAAPFLFGFSPAAMLVAVLVGAVTVGIALAGTLDERGRPALPVSAVHAYDWGTGLGLLGAALVIAVAGADLVAGAVLGAIALAQVVGNLTTRYSIAG